MSGTSKNKFTALDLILVIVFILAAVFFIGAMRYAYINKGTFKQTPPAITTNTPPQTIPRFQLRDLFAPTQNFTIGGIESGQMFINFFASWCAPCRAEHPILLTLAEKTDIPIIGITFGDQDKAAQNFLRDLGNPFDQVGVDESLKLAPSLGVGGIPASFLIGADGRILWRRLGQLTHDDLTDLLTKL